MSTCTCIEVLLFESSVLSTVKSKLKGLQNSGIRHNLGITVLAIKREGEDIKYSPAADAVLSAGDQLIVMGEPSRLRELEALAGVKK